MNDSIEEQEYLAHMHSTLGFHNDALGSARTENNYDGVGNNGGGQSYNPSGSDIQEELRYFANSEPHNPEHNHNEHHQHHQQQYHQQNNHFAGQDEHRISHRDQVSRESTTVAYGNAMTVPNHNALYHQQQLHSHAVQAMSHPHYQNVYQSSAAVPIPQMAVQLSNIFATQHPITITPTSQLPLKTVPTPLPPVVHDGEPPKPRSFEEEYAIIIQRTASAAAKSSNTKYRCLFCNFTFVGGPQKIRVHLTGKRENGTRLSRCENCPEEVRKKLEERMKAPKELVSDSGLFEDNEANTPSLPPRNVEEHHCIVLSRSGSSNSKSSNTRYKCIYCRFKFVGGPQKIRVHLTGQPEGGTRMAKCSRVPPEVIEQMELRRKAPRPDVLSAPPSNLQALEQHHGLSAGSSSSSSHGHGGAPQGEVQGLPSGVHPTPSLAAHLQQQNAQQHALGLGLHKQQQANHTQQQLHLQQHQQQLAHLQRQQQIQQQLQLQQQQQHMQHQHQHQHQLQQHLQHFHHQQQQMHQQQAQQQHQHQQQGLPLPLGGMLPHSQIPQHLLPQGLPLHLHAPQHMMQHPGQILLQQQHQQQQQQQQHLQRQQHQHNQLHQMQLPHNNGNGTLPPHHVFHNAQAGLPVSTQGTPQSVPAGVVLHQVVFPLASNSLSHAQTLPSQSQTQLQGQESAQTNEQRQGGDQSRHQLTGTGSGERSTMTQQVPVQTTAEEDPAVSVGRLVAPTSTSTAQLLETLERSLQEDHSQASSPLRPSAFTETPAAGSHTVSQAPSEEAVPERVVGEKRNSSHL